MAHEVRADERRHSDLDDSAAGCLRRRLNRTPPRVRIWLLMLVVALVALGSSAWPLARRSKQYRTMAVYYETRETSWRRPQRRYEIVGQRYRKISESQRRTRLKGELELAARRAENLASKTREFADGDHTIAVAYRRAARYPWLGPPRIEPPPTLPRSLQPQFIGP
jgi:hypothetical protein